MKLFSKSLKKLSLWAGLSLSILCAPFAALADVAMWKVSDKDTTIYVMGTIHILPPDTNWETDKIKKALKESDSLVLEVHPDALSPAEMQALVMKHGMLPEGEFLEDKLDHETFEMIKAMFGANPQAWAQISRMRPWMIGVMLSVQTMMANGYDPNSGVEKVLEKKAKAQNKKIEGLESAEYQLQVLSSFGVDAKSGMLKDLIDDLPKVTETVDAMKDEWLEGDVEGLAAIMNDEMDEYPEVYEALLTVRNKNWVVQMKDMMKKPGKKFMAVGAGHLSGKDNVIGMLKAAGMKVERVQ